MEMMKYLIWVTEKDNSEKMYAAPVDKIDSDYFKREVTSYLKPISQAFYCQSFCAILQTLSRWSYVLYNEKLYWCILWGTSGLIVLEFQDDGTIQGVALRSPHKDEHWNDGIYENHQYNLVYTAWDAQFEEEKRTWKNFKPISNQDVEKQHFNKCILPIDTLAPKIEEAYQKDTENFMKKCLNRVEQWFGEGRKTKMDCETPPLW